ncbi:MAG: hypothetical protein HYT22_01375 [Candidatus Niyogibacteria bacterium]|nr:hypothetical protein [Candidatus Niyogibacteria bacterium]
MPDDTIQDAKTGLEFHAKKLAALIIVSSMPQSVKEAWVALLPIMKLPQIARFLDILEAKYLNEKTKMVDETYKHELADFLHEVEESDNERELALIKKIDALA